MGGRLAATDIRGGLGCCARRRRLPAHGTGANVPAPYSWDLQPPTTNREAFIKWAVENRGEHPSILAARWERYVFLRANNDFVNAQWACLSVDAA